MSTIYEASKQWATRPDDERFASIEDLHASALEDRNASAVARVKSTSLRFGSDGEEVTLIGETGAQARMTSHAFAQECAAVSAPASYLATLPAELAARNLQESHSQVFEERERVLLFHRNGGLILRGSTSPKYARIWDCEVTARLLDLQSQGWRVPLAWAKSKDQKGARVATAEDVEAFKLGASIVKAGDTVAPSGLYRSAKDFFAFLIDPTRRVKSPSGRDLFRGFTVGQSEVGSQAWILHPFLFDFVCGNHNIWGAESLGEVRVIHTGDARDAWGEKVDLLHAFQNRAASEDESRLLECAKFKLGEDRSAVIDRAFGAKLLNRADAGAAFDMAKEFEDGGDPTSAWGFANGLTRLSQTRSNGDERMRLDRAAGKVLALAF